MHRILLLIQHHKNYQLLSDFLAKDYDVLPAEPLTDSDKPALNGRDFDLCLVDGTTLNQVLPWLTKTRAEVAPLWLPVLLVLPKGKADQVSHQCWQSVDEIIATPIEKVELMTRIGMLLKVHQLSQDLLEANQVLQQRNEQLQELNRLKSQFVSMVSHEFQNPLGTVSGFLQLLSRQGDELALPKRQEYLAKAQATLKHLKALVNDVLIIGRVGVGKLKFEPATTHLIELCQTLMEEVRFNMAQSRTIEFSVVPGFEKTLSAIMVDKNLLRQIVTNLLTNALKYSPQDCPVRFSLGCQEGTISLRIQDHGIGIPEEEQKRLFEPFYRASNVSSQPGTGLGLAITQQCVELHGGVITFTSDLQAGTTFEVRLPLLT